MTTIKKQVNNYTTEYWTEPLSARYTLIQHSHSTKDVFIHRLQDKPDYELHIEASIHNALGGLAFTILGHHGLLKLLVSYGSNMGSQLNGYSPYNIKIKSNMSQSIGHSICSLHWDYDGHIKEDRFNPFGYTGLAELPHVDLNHLYDLAEELSDEQYDELCTEYMRKKLDKDMVDFFESVA